MQLRSWEALRGHASGVKTVLMSAIARALNFPEYVNPFRVGAGSKAVLIRRWRNVPLRRTIMDGFFGMGKRSSSARSLFGPGPWRRRLAPLGRPSLGPHLRQDFLWGEGGIFCDASDTQVP